MKTLVRAILLYGGLAYLAALNDFAAWRNRRRARAVAFR